MDNFTEDALVEQPAIQEFASLGWTTENLMYEGTSLGRTSEEEVVLVSKLRPVLERLNPDIPATGINQAIEELRRDRQVMDVVAANREVYTLLKEGFDVSFEVNGETTSRKVFFIDWNTPENNDFFLASQYWVRGAYGRKRPDLVGFINGIPLILAELKARTLPITKAYDDIQDYKTTIPQLFVYNAFVLISNGRETRVGSFTAGFSHFAEWKKLSSESESPKISLQTAIQGTCAVDRCLDILENFLFYSEESAGTVKILAKNHQYLGVNNAIAAVLSLKDNAGRLGTYWHTQGSGKSYSMLLFAQKVFRKLRGNWTFVIVTDRIELDEQIFKTFSRTGAVTKEGIQASSGEHLKQLLREDNRYVFSLIQKFRNEPNKPYPELSQRSDIIVMTDEAHRGQYALLAKNMRDALPRAAFIGFTGTPLMEGDEKTREVFGDYVSVYDFQDAIRDNATVPLYYENRIPQLQLDNKDFNEDMQELLDAVVLGEAEEAKLEHEFSHEYHLITREERLDTIAEDLVKHFLSRGEFGKAMVVSIDKATAVRMYDKVKREWARELHRLQLALEGLSGEAYEALHSKIQFMLATDMAVVVSPSKNEIEAFKAKGLDIAEHRKRMAREKLDEKFKEASDPLRIVFLCAMWLTGFDAPSVSTVYLDKPMRNHTLMQTIARANRVWQDKNNGLIIDYVGVFRNLEKALSVYATGRTEGGSSPVKPKDELIHQLEAALDNAFSFLEKQGIDTALLNEAMEAPFKSFKDVELLDDAYDMLLISDDVKKEFVRLARQVDRLFRASLPTGKIEAFIAKRALLVHLLKTIESGGIKPDISEVMAEVEALLDVSIAATPYVIDKGFGAEHRHDLSKLDVEALRKRFETGKKRTELEKLRGQLNAKVQQMVRLNKSRLDYAQRLEQLIDAYNSGTNLDVVINQLLSFTDALSQEEERHVKEGLSEEELAVFDLLTRVPLKLNSTERNEVKRLARDVLAKVRKDLVLDWRKSQQMRARVELAVKDGLDALPESYDKALWEQTVAEVYQHLFNCYYGEGKSIYS